VNVHVLSPVVRPGRGSQRKTALETGVALINAKRFKPRQGAVKYLP